MFRKYFTIFTRRAVEIFGAILLALVCFMAFLFILKMLFPFGTSLSELMKGVEPHQSKQSGGYLTGEAAEPFAATLSRYSNLVKAKSSGDIAWSNVREGMSLFDRDAVQTSKQSSAIIAFDKANSLEMGSNSLVIVKSLAHEKNRQVRKSVLVVVDGELRGRISGTASNAVEVEMALPAGVARVQTQKSADGSTDFTVRVNPDKSSTVTVHHGVAEVMAQGKTVRVGANLSTTVSLTGPPTTPRSLPGAPALLAPAASANFAYRELPPKISFSWQVPAGSRQSRFLLARDADFKQVVVDEKVGDAAYSHGNLRQGEYFWKVGSIDGWTEGKSGPARRFRIVQDLEPPELLVESPPSLLEERQYLLKGTCEAGAELFVNNKPVPTGASGQFAQLLPLQRGINLITVEAVDNAGNISYKTHKVISKF